MAQTHYKKLLRNVLLGFITEQAQANIADTGSSSPTIASPIVMKVAR